jgi:hypothetical protein
MHHEATAAPAPIEGSARISERRPGHSLGLAES